ncbi:hypothetical protein BDK51DRAFT_48997 [Blyttiomyces helicus]|uniref:Aminotransferase class I/classII domain-containing protein n=1 Tax=Blyttiomyces helicus TaxID=388810 RepID=A0A4P9W3I5_9FUNG|nr:hypothetical protein BDK51DRAFT_48997 [Blyttiomyces helicus]|eukprot:RKO86694.1 hypothetical protein BDK51DRAFT_48997 [Blyttiomyces helicus]
MTTFDSLSWTGIYQSDGGIRIFFLMFFVKVCIGFAQASRHHVTLSSTQEFGMERGGERESQLHMHQVGPREDGKHPQHRKHHRSLDMGQDSNVGAGQKRDDARLALFADRHPFRIFAAQARTGTARDEQRATSVDQEPTKSRLAEWLIPSDPADAHSRILLGNGASELIDLVTRAAPAGAWKPGPWPVQYKEYERSAIALGRTVLTPADPTPAGLTCIVNPNNPTGDYMHIEELKAYIEVNVPDGTDVMVGE